MKIYPYLRNYFILLLASQGVILAIVYILMKNVGNFTTWNMHGEPIMLSLHQFQFVIIWIVNLFVVWFIKMDFDHNKIKAPWVLLLTMLTSSSGIVIAWLLLHVANREQPDEHRSIN